MGMCMRALMCICVCVTPCVWLSRWHYGQRARLRPVYGHGLTEGRLPLVAEGLEE